MIRSNEGPLKVLLVEDHEIARIGLRYTLESLPDLCIIGEACDGENAVSQAISLIPDVVLMDLGLPVMDGINATKQIKSKLPDIRVLILTSHESWRYCNCWWRDSAISKWLTA